MEKFLSLFAAVPAMATDDYVGFTFFVGCMAMMAASAFFFLSMSSFDNKWRTSILVSGLITFIAVLYTIGTCVTTGRQMPLHQLSSVMWTGF